MINVGINKKNSLVLDFPYNPDIVEIVRTLPSRNFNKKAKLWEIPLIDLPIIRDEFIKKNNLSINLSASAQDKYLEQIQKYKFLKLISELQDTEYDMLGLKSNIIPYPFQKVSARYLEESKKSLLALDMGLGKTLCSIIAASNLIQKNKVGKILVICPSSLKFNWAEEIIKFSDYSFKIIGGDATSRKLQYNNGSVFTIINYDLLKHDLKYIKSVKPDLIIADEIQRIKNYYTQTFKNIKLLKSEYIFGLTGTPIENSIMDLFTIMRFINPAFFGTNGLYFKQRYCMLDGWGTIHGIRQENMHEINRKVSYFMFRRKKRDVLKDLPDKAVKTYHIELSKEERKIYDKHKKVTVNEIHDNILEMDDDNILKKIVFLREICDCINLVEPQEKIVSSKLEELKLIMQDIPEDSKVIIFSEYERMAKILEDNLGYKFLHLHGGIKSDCKYEKELEKDTIKNNKDLNENELNVKIGEERKKAVCKNCPYFNDDSLCNTRKKMISKFNQDDSYKGLISTNAGKEGLNLQKACVLINYDLSFNPAVNEQRIGRIDRIGQEAEKIFVINLVCEDTIEERVQEKLADKQGLFDKLIDRSDKAILKAITRQELLELL